MNKRSYIILLLLLSTSLFCQVQEGVYASSFRYVGKLVIKKNNLYEQTCRDCTWGFTTSGSYIQKGDTVILNATKIYDTHLEKKVNIEQKALYRSADYTKYLIRHDSLILLFRSNYKTYFNKPLFRMPDKN